MDPIEERTHDSMTEAGPDDILVATNDQQSLARISEFEPSKGPTGVDRATGADTSGVNDPPRFTEMLNY